MYFYVVLGDGDGVNLVYIYYHTLIIAVTVSSVNHYVMDDGRGEAEEVLKLGILYCDRCFDMPLCCC